MRWTINNARIDKQKDTFMLVVVVLTTCPPWWIDPQPSAGSIAHGVWMMPVRLFGVPLHHRGW